MDRHLIDFANNKEEYIDLLHKIDNILPESIKKDYLAKFTRDFNKRRIFKKKFNSINDLLKLNKFHKHLFHFERKLVSDISNFLIEYYYSTYFNLLNKLI